MSGLSAQWRCPKFRRSAIVYDLRFLGAIAEPPEILVPADMENLDPNSLPEVEVCALVADPGDSRELNYAMVACPPSASGQCDEKQVQVQLGSGEVSDPEESDSPISLYATLGPSPGLLEVIEESVSLDSLAGFGAIDIQVEISIWPRGNREQTILPTRIFVLVHSSPQAEWQMRIRVCKAWKRV